jgi:hypothetical protein
VTFLQRENPIHCIFRNYYYYMAFQNSLFWLVDKRSVKTHIRTVARIFRIWTGVPDVVYLAGNFCFANKKNVCFLNFQLCFTDKNFKQPNCFDWACMPTVYCYPVKLTIADLIRAKSRCSHMPIADLIRAKSICSVFCMDLAPSSLGPY